MLSRICSALFIVSLLLTISTATYAIELTKIWSKEVPAAVETISPDYGKIAIRTTDQYWIWDENGATIRQGKIDKYDDFCISPDRFIIGNKLKNIYDYSGKKIATIDEMGYGFFLQRDRM